MKEITIIDDENAEVEALQVVITDKTPASEPKAIGGGTVKKDQDGNLYIEKKENSHLATIKAKLEALRSQRAGLDSEIANWEAIEAEVEAKLQIITDARSAKTQ